MKEVTYAGKVFITGDAIADALLETVAALGASEETRAVEIPVVDRDSQLGSVVDIVIGPSSEIIAMPAQWHGDELVDDAAVDYLHKLTRSTSHASHPVASETDVNYNYLDADFDS